VVAAGEFGEVEEIGLTHVSLKVWDKHRLILSVSYFVEKPFQNWTKGSPAVLGTVLIYTDFTVPVKELRAEFDRVLAGTDLFDGKSQTLDVTNLTADKVELRAGQRGRQRPAVAAPVPGARGAAHLAAVPWV
jgi:hypothetical protein